MIWIRKRVSSEIFIIHIGITDMRRMKQLFLMALAIIMSSGVYAQSIKEGAIPAKVADVNDTIRPWTGKLIGLNVFPAVGVLSNGSIPQSKLSIQYRELQTHWNVRYSLNLTNFYQQPRTTDIVQLKNDTAILRNHLRSAFHLDGRFGAERAVHVNKWRLFYGGGVVLGYGKQVRSYYQWIQPYDEFPISNIHMPNGTPRRGYYEAGVLRAGFDLNIGVDLMIARNVVLTLQYTPEFVYHKVLSLGKEDIDAVYDYDWKDAWDFRADIFDIILSVKF